MPGAGGMFLTPVPGPFAGSLEELLWPLAKIPPTAVGGAFKSLLQNNGYLTEESHQRELVDGSCPT